MSVCRVKSGDYRQEDAEKSDMGHRDMNDDLGEKSEKERKRQRQRQREGENFFFFLKT